MAEKAGKTRDQLFESRSLICVRSGRDAQKTLMDVLDSDQITGGRACFPEVIARNLRGLFLHWLPRVRAC